MEKPTRVEVGQRYRGPFDGPNGDAIVAVLRSGVCNEHPEIPHVHWSSGGWDQIHRFEPKCDPRLTYLGGPQPEQRWAMLGNCLVDARLYPGGGTQPSPEVPPPMKSEGGLPAGCLLCGEKCTTNYSCEAHNEVEFWSAFKPCIADWAVGKRDFPRPTTPLVPLEGEEPGFFLCDLCNSYYRSAAPHQCHEFIGPEYLPERITVPLDVTTFPSFIGPEHLRVRAERILEAVDAAPREMWACSCGEVHPASEPSCPNRAAMKPPAAPQGKPHDWSDPYLIWSGEPSCVGCGSDPGTPKKWCTPIPGWRLDRERRISDAQTAADDAKASGSNWIQRRKGTQAALPEGRFQSHLIGQGAIGIWSLRSHDGK